MINGERTRPPTIMVNRQARRFANEAANYNAFGAAFHQIDLRTYDYANIPSCMLFDGRYLRTWGLAGWTGDGETPSWLHCPDTIQGLATSVGLDPEALATTVRDWNVAAAAGRDPEFHRGESAHDQWWGDPKLLGSPAANLGPLDEPPYYAVQVHPAALGTRGGPRTDGDARVLDVDGDPIEGLYAAGNAAASMMGMTYGGAGGTLGPAVVFGYRAGRHVATR